MRCQPAAAGLPGEVYRQQLGRTGSTVLRLVFVSIAIGHAGGLCDSVETQPVERCRCSLDMATPGTARPTSPSKTAGKEGSRRAIDIKGGAETGQALCESAPWSPMRRPVLLTLRAPLPRRARPCLPPPAPHQARGRDSGRNTDEGERMWRQHLQVVRQTGAQWLRLAVGCGNCQASRIHHPVSTIVIISRRQSAIPTAEFDFDKVRGASSGVEGGVVVWGVAV